MNEFPFEYPKSLPEIMVVDDTPANLNLLNDMLTGRGFKVRPVPDGKLAIQAVHNKKPDLILLDINMPGMNGYEVCEYLKSNPDLKNIPVLFISALDDSSDKVKAFAVGGVDYVTKPFHFDEVEARIKTHLRLRQLQIELEEKNNQIQENFNRLKRLEELQDNLTHMIIHDMRSPLMAITLSLELMELNSHNNLNEDDLKLVYTAQKSGATLLNMVNSLLDVSRLEQGQMPLEFVDIDIDDLIQSAVDTLGLLTNHVSLSFQKQPNPLIVNCDSSIVTRIITNLLGNALKFSPENGKISIVIEKYQSELKLSISDNGIGIPSEYHKRIFEKFGQVETQQQFKSISSGLGLTFCKLAVEAFGGKIDIESETGKGSTFWFTIPFDHS